MAKKVWPEYLRSLSTGELKRKRKAIASTMSDLIEISDEMLAEMERRKHRPVPIDSRSKAS